MDNISIVESELLYHKVQLILRQTDYSEETAREKLNEFHFNEEAVIRDYFGIPKKEPHQIKSVNQEIYRNLRSHLDGAMRDYRGRVERGEAKKII